jgi:hypothetical protein
MKVKLVKDHSIRGTVEKADTIISDGVALDLVKRGIAKKLSKPKADK